MSELWWLAALSLVPWVELRGSIPLAVAVGYPPLASFVACTAANLLAIPLGWAFLDWTYRRWLSRWPWVRRQVERVRRRGEGYVRRYEALGLALFVAVPLPGTGAYAGTLLAWLLGLPRARAWAAVAAGVVLAGIVVTAVVTGVVAGWKWAVR
ncbi:MAG: small multi-drug export protein [Armatimonadota bacterium]|nr:small multi-drug export protein [Armatimonadota bacterium]MDW8156717.1 small multi-drug export protein [Armatimonadota bacterium]